MRTRGSIKRRPPSRRFRRSQSDCGELGDFRAEGSSQENGARDEAGDEVFLPRSKAPGSPPPGEGAAGREAGEAPGAHEKPPLRETPSKTEKQEDAPQLPEKPAGDAQEEAPPPRPAPSTEAEGRCGSPGGERPAAEQREEPAHEEGAGGEGEPAQQSQDSKPLEEGAVGQEAPQSPPGGAERSLAQDEGRAEGKQEEETVLEPGCHPRTSSEVPETEGLFHPGGLRV